MCRSVESGAATGELARMASTLANFVFWIAAVAIVCAQILILRSTRRGMRLGPPGSSSLLEWTFAILPVIAVALLLVGTWSAMHPETFRVDAIAPRIGASS